MALDSYTHKLLAYELGKKLIGGRIDKIYQMSRIQLLFTVRSLGENHRLYISCDAGKGRVCLTDMKFENPDVPPVFCMLLRKHLAGGKITDISSVLNERIIRISVENTNELFETVSKTLVVEMMGKYSNIILLNSDNRIIDAVTHVDFTVSEKRQVLPGLFYELPPVSDKKNPFNTEYSEMLDCLSEGEDIAKSLMDNFLGISPIMAREIQYRANNDAITACTEYKRLLKDIEENKRKPIVLIEKSTNKPKDVYYTDIFQYEDYYEKKYFDTLCSAVDFFYSSCESVRKIDEKKAELTTLVYKHIKRVSKKLDIHIRNLEKAKDKDKYRIYAELITANLYRLNENSKFVRVENYYDNNNLITIPMDETLSPSRNGKKYFEKYNKEKNMEKISSRMAEELNLELSYLNEVSDMIMICDDLKALSEIKDELSEEGYIEEKKNKKGNKKNTVSGPNEFLSTDGFQIFAGKNNRQNEILTLKSSSKNDLWFHIRNAAGSHVVIKTEGREVSDNTILEAATIAAQFSKRANDTKVDIDYTLIKYVKKPSGAKPGMVIYDNFKGITVEPDLKLVEKLRIK